MSELEATAKLQTIWRRPLILRMLVVALLAEIGYAVLNISAMPIYLRLDRQFSEGAIGLVLTAFLLSEAVFKSPLGHLADKIGRKTLMVLGPSLTVGTSLLSLVVPHGAGTFEVVLFVVLRVFDGIGASMLWPAAFATVGDAVEDSQRQQAMSMLNMVYLLGVALALPLGGIVNDVTGLRWASLVLAAILFATVAVVMFLTIPRDQPGKHKHETPAPEQAEADVGELIRSASQIPAYLILAVITFIGVGFPMAIIKLFAYDELKMSESKFGALVLPAALAMAVLSVPLSKLGERLGRARAVHLGMGLCALGLWFIALGAFVPALRSVWVLALGGIPVGLGFLLAIPAWMASVSDVDPRKRSAYLGAVMTAQGVGAIIGAPVGGFLYQSMGRYSPFVGCAACVTAGWLIGLKILREPN